MQTIKDSQGKLLKDTELNRMNEYLNISTTLSNTNVNHNQMSTLKNPTRSNQPYAASFNAEKNVLGTYLFIRIELFHYFKNVMRLLLLFLFFIFKILHSKLFLQPFSIGIFIFFRTDMSIILELTIFHSSIRENCSYISSIHFG